MKLVIGISGASGALYGIEMLKACKDLGVETHLVMSKWGEKNIEIETDYSVENVKDLATHFHANNNLASLISSGSFKHDGMAIVPCSMKTLSAVSTGYTDSLLTRAADVTIKEGRKLVIVPRETPLSAIHLENMLKLARLGVVMMPPMPAMYAKPGSVADLILHTVSRVLDQFGIENSLGRRWSGINLP